MPANIPINDQRVQFELTRYLSDNWVPILEKDIDGANSLPLRLDGEVPNLGKFAACRRVARTIYLGSAPTPTAGNRGVAPGAPKTSWEAEVNRAHAVATANLSSKSLAEQSIPELRSALNAEKDPTRQSVIYAILKSKERGSGPQLTDDQAAPFDPAKDLPGWKPVEVKPAPLPKSLPADADTPVKIQRLLDLTNFEDLLSMLENVKHSPLQQSLLFAEVRRRRTIASDPQ